MNGLMTGPVDLVSITTSPPPPPPPHPPNDIGPFVVVAVVNTFAGVAAAAAARGDGTYLSLAEVDELLFWLDDILGG
jgi:hypothetical protein